MDIKKQTRVIYSISKGGHVAVHVITEYYNLMPELYSTVRKEAGHFSFILSDSSEIVETLKAIVLNLIKSNIAFAAEVGTDIVLFDKQKKEITCEFSIPE